MNEMKDKAAPLPFSWRKDSLEAREILRQVHRASLDFAMIEPGDRILVACSGGKDSYALAWVMERIRREMPFEFEIVALNIDMGFGGGFRQDVVGEYLKAQDLRVELVTENAGEVCAAKLKPEENPCWMCARLRRGILYTQAKRLGCNKLALGHHADDLIETLLMNEFFTGQIKAMPPRLKSDDGELIVIRPLAYVFEATLIAFARQMRFPVVGCNCPHGCQLMVSERHEIKKLLNQLSVRLPNMKTNLLASLTRVRPSHLMDKKLYDFKK